MLSEAKRYHRLKYTFFLADLGLTIFALVFLQASGLSSHLNELILSYTANRAVCVALYVLIFFNLMYVLFLPIRFFSGYWLEKKFRLSDQKPSRWAADAAKSYGLSLVFFMILAELFYYGVDAFPRHWWMAAAGGWFFITVILTRILPTLLIPIFYPLKVYPEGPLKERLRSLCRRCGVRVLDIYEIALSKKTKKGNAALVGLGRSRRILLGDTLAGKYTDDEIEMVVAHEIGHHALRHIPRMFAYSFGLTFAGFYLLFLFAENIAAWAGAGGIGDLSLLPALLLLSTVGGLFLLPLQNGLSRRHENEADDYALRMLPEPDVFISVMEKLGGQNLADRAPNPVLEFFFYDHPSIGRRIRRAQVRP